MTRQISALRRQAKPVEAELLAIIASLQQRLRLMRPVRVLVSAVADCPSVVGWIEPVVLLPAATESVINSKNADRIRAKILVEGANSPTTPPADDMLFDRGVFVIPDILANAGGVTVSYFEWVQDRGGYFWSEKVVNERLEEIMVAAFEQVVGNGERHHVNNRIAAYMLAIDRVAFSMKLRGIYA